MPYLSFMIAALTLKNHVYRRAGKVNVGYASLRFVDEMIASSCIYFVWMCARFSSCGWGGELWATRSESLLKATSHQNVAHYSGLTCLKIANIRSTYNRVSFLILAHLKKAIAGLVARQHPNKFFVVGDKNQLKVSTVPSGSNQVR